MNKISINNSSTLFLKIILLLASAVIFILMIRLPLVEGRAANLDLFSIYTDPFIIYIYIGSIPFFIGISQAIKLLNLIDQNSAFTQNAVNTLKNMKIASLSLIGFIASAIIYLHLSTSNDDLAGPTMLGICSTLAFGSIATAAGLFQKLFQNAVDMKSENDLTV